MREERTVELGVKGGGDGLALDGVGEEEVGAVGLRVSPIMICFSLFVFFFSCYAGLELKFWPHSRSL